MAKAELTSLLSYFLTASRLARRAVLPVRAGGRAASRFDEPPFATLIVAALEALVFAGILTRLTGAWSGAIRSKATVARRSDPVAVVLILVPTGLSVLNL